MGAGKEKMHLQESVIPSSLPPSCSTVPLNKPFTIVSSATLRQPANNIRNYTDFVFFQTSASTATLARRSAGTDGATRLGSEASIQMEANSVHAVRRCTFILGVTTN